MSLVGRLEDLSVGEILQIVSLSKRSGLLRLESPSDKANIYIRSGKVLYAARSDEKEGLLSLLVHHGLVKMDHLDDVREELESVTDTLEARRILQEKLGISQDAFQKVLQDRVKEMVFSLFHWGEGTFSFQLIEDEKDEPVLRKMTPLFLDQGIEAQFLVMEGARRKDEMGRGLAPEVDEDQEPPRGESDMDAPPAVDTGPSREWPVPGDGPVDLIGEFEGFSVPDVLPPVGDPPYGTVLLIGLSRDLSAGIADALGGKGITLLTNEGGADGLTRIQELRRNRITPFLVLDIEAAGITDDRKMGGLEILSTIWELGFNVPVGMVYREAIPDGLRQKLEQVPGIHLFPVSGSPGSTKTDDDTVKLIETVILGTSGPPPEGVESVPGPGDQPATPEAVEEYYDIQGELVDDLDGIDLPFEGWEEKEPPREESLDPHMAQLSSFVQELNRQDISGEITLLALRFASAFVSRAVLFLVRKGDMKGLGQFGVDLGEGKNSDAAVRSLTLPMGSEGIFTRVTMSQQSYKGPPMDSGVERELFEALGGDVPGEIYIGPIVSMGKVAVLLYGDDIPGDRGIEPTHTLDIFLSHVGLALDRAFLEMKLKTQRS
jgi:hypothetical protein